MNDVVEQGGPPWVRDRFEGIEAIREPGSAMVVDWSFERYLRASDFVSRSALEDLRSKGPAYYHAKYIARTMPDRSSAAMETGTHLHTRLLEPDRWARELFVWQEVDRPAGAHGRAKKDSPERRLYDAWKAACASREAERDQAIADGKTILDPDQVTKIESMARSLLDHPFGAKMFGEGGTNETTVLWHHESGLLIRCRLDRMFPLDDETRVILDAKSTKDPSPAAFGKSIASYGYHSQGAIYTDAARALYPDIDFHYVIAAVRSEPPYESAFYELGEDTLELGRARYTAAINELVRCRTDNDWNAPWQVGCVDINLPGWAYYED